MRNKEGKPIRHHVLWSKKTRLFCFSRKSFPRLVRQLIDQYVEVVKNILKKIDIRFRIRKKAAKGQWHYFNRKVCQEINMMKQYIEFYCNYAAFLQRSNYHKPWYEEYRGKAAPVPKMKELISLFHKYKKRFEKQSFHDNAGTYRRISYKHVQLPELEENLDILFNEFRKEIVNIIPGVFE